MRIALVLNGVIPIEKYGGTERVVWDLASELHKKGHEITFIIKEESKIPFGKKIPIESINDIRKDLPLDLDVVHFHSGFEGMEEISIPFIFTMHGNVGFGQELHKNTVFISKNQANRFGVESYVHNGLNWDNYQKPNLLNKRDHFHFLGKAAWRVKNLRGAIDIVKESDRDRLFVMGGDRFNINMGIRFTFTKKAKFFGMIDNNLKSSIMNSSKGLIFPVLWNEPFGLAIIESLYFGCPVFGTPYGSLPELISKKLGFLSNSVTELQQAIKYSECYSKEYCHQFAMENFNSQIMAENYIAMYEKVIDNKTIHSKRPTLIEFEPKFLPWINNKL